MAKHTITVIPGEGTGPEIWECVQMILDASGVDLAYEFAEAGLPAVEKYGTPVPPETIESIKKNKVCMKGPTTTPVGYGHKSANVTLRKALDLYANVRPARSLPGVKTPWPNIDLIGIRENTEDSYAAIEHMVSDEVAQCLKVITRPGSLRIIDFAFRYARAHNRKKVTVVHKANIMKLTDGLFLNCGREVAARYPDIEFQDLIVDNMAMQLVLKPHLYDVICLPNLYGDILTDLMAGLTGGLGFAPGANIGDKYAMFEAVHGSTPKYIGMKRVNPSAVLQAAIMMLEHIGEKEAAVRIHKAMCSVLEEGKTVTADLGGTATNEQYAKAIVERLKAG